ncbi:MAG: hypothetical protein GY757_53195 [bacterium]|nr:hypothetical protein [bacterium]
MFQNHKYSFIRILKGDGKSKEPIGAGFLVTPTHLLTCAHVVAKTTEMPVDLVYLDFPLLKGQPAARANVIKWYPIKEKAGTGELEDIAVLELLQDPPLPEEITPATLVHLETNNFTHRPVRMCGFPKGVDQGTYANGTLQGPTGKGWIEIHHDLSGGMVEKGFSGTAVWDKKENAVSGMIVSTMIPSREKVAYMIPAESLIRAFPQLEKHSRPPTPYKGLKAFREKDAPFFFGREGVTRDLYEIVEKQPFVAVIGASGSGKSSVIFAGLIPGLNATGKWLVCHFRPKDAPFYNLAMSLIPLLYNDELQQMKKTKELAKDFRQGKIELVDFIRKIAKKHPQKRLLLFADQFEELFTLNPDKDLRQRFLELLPQPQALSNLPFTFLFTLRTDFMSQTVEYEPFVHALDKYKPKFLASMNEEELTAVIEKPAKKLGVTFAPGLTQRILQELGDEPGNLPLLEFALSQLWEKQRFRVITHEAYDDIGGVKQSLARHANRVFEGFDEKKWLRQIFIQLVCPGEGTKDTRQLALRDHFNTKKWQFVQQLADERLLVTGRDEDNKQDTVELVHETLIQSWKPLREWMTEDRSFRVWQNNLRQAITDWVDAKKDDGQLLRGVRLTDSEEKLEQRENELGNDEIDFIRLSITLRETEKNAKEQELLEKEKLRKRIRRTGSIALVVLLVIMGVWGWRENSQTKKLNKSLKNMEKANKLAKKNLIEARHNLGSAFYEKANSALKIGNFNAARLYALNALKNFDPKRDEPRNAAGMIISYPDYPGRFFMYKSSHHNGPVNSVIFSQTGNTLASGSSDYTIRLWDVETGNKKVLPGHQDTVLCVSFSEDGSMLASSSRDNTIRLWDVETGNNKVLKGHTDNVWSVSFSPDGNTLASGSTDHTIRLWDVGKGNEKKKFTNHTKPVFCVSFSPDGTTLASGSSDNTIRLWDVRRGEEKKKLTNHTKTVWSVSFSPDGTTLASGSSDNTIRLWDVETGKEKKVLKEHERSIRSVSFSPDSKTLASGAEDQTIRLWDVKTEKTKILLTGHSGSVRSVSFSPDSKTLASGADDKTIRLWKLGKEKSLLYGNTHFVNSVSFSPDKRTLASGLRDNSILLWDVDTRKKKKKLTGHREPIKCVSFSPDGKILASGSMDKRIFLWEVDKWERKKVLTAHTGYVSCVSFSPDSNTLASGSFDRDVRLWNLITGEKKVLGQREDQREDQRTDQHTDPVHCVSFSLDGKTLASGAEDKTIRLWDGATGKKKIVLKGHTDSINSVAFSPDGKTLASGSSDHTIILWDVATGKKKNVLKEHTGSIYSVIFSPDGKMLASGGKDTLIYLRDVETGMVKAVLEGHMNFVNSVTFLPESNVLLASGANDKTIRLWNLSFLYDKRSIEKKIRAAEKAYNLELSELQLHPIPPGNKK